MRNRVSMSEQSACLAENHIGHPNGPRDPARAKRRWQTPALECHNAFDAEGGVLFGPEVILLLS